MIIQIWWKKIKLDSVSRSLRQVKCLLAFKAFLLNTLYNQFRCKIYYKLVYFLLNCTAKHEFLKRFSPVFKHFSYCLNVQEGRTRLAKVSQEKAKRRKVEKERVKRGKKGKGKTKQERERKARKEKTMVYPAQRSQAPTTSW